MSFAIRVENLGKRYQLGMTHSRSIRELVNRVFHRLLGRRQEPLPHEEKSLAARRDDIDRQGGFWALRDVSFEVMPGEVVGIIGRNGSGKSTLLKVLSQITAPTRGQAEVRGRVASLLEVGTGFHPELSGRDNVFLNGAILGMTKAEVRSKFDEIVAFAEVEKFIDTPVKRYSSGMHVRLAFAVAAHLEPEIVLVDEVLAVGDIAFQKKCLGKMSEVARGGRTVVFVNHDLGAVARLCTRALWLDKGEVGYEGEVTSAIAHYLRTSGPKGGWREWSEPTAPGDEDLRALRVELLGASGTRIDMAYQDDPLSVRIVYRVLQTMPNANVGFELRAESGPIVFASYDADSPEWSGRGRKPGVYTIACSIPGNLLNEGTYWLTLVGGIPSIKRCFRADDVVRLIVNRARTAENPVGRMNARRPGVIAPDLEWTVRATS